MRSENFTIHLRSTYDIKLYIIFVVIIGQVHCVNFNYIRARVPIYYAHNIIIIIIVLIIIIAITPRRAIQYAADIFFLV